ncbi:MAG: ATP-binding cassette domain-containing protein [Bacteroidales bacterium]|nr:ATP-binding cassette domain-containing protein [Bacteroidales bacterium]
MSALLEIKDLYGGYTKGVDILRGINLEVQQGEVVGIIGLNGAGKSTFGKAVMNMLPIRRGTILFEGKDVTQLETHELARHGMAIMQQGGRVFRNLSVWDNLQLAANSANVNQRKIMRDIIPLLHSSPRQLQRMMGDKLSGGQQHQISLAMTLATGSRFVVLDEPSAGLSPKATEEMYNILRECRENLNLTIVLIEQHIAKVQEFCDYILEMNCGKINSLST